MDVIGNKARLVYYIYVPKDGLPEIYKYHFACLEYFSHIFDEFNITIALDDVNDIDSIRAVEGKFISFTNKDISFKIIQNNPYCREAYSFKTEILDKLGIDNSLTFFGHAKGVTNEFNDSLIIWICSMYYFCLNFMDNMKYQMLNQSPRLFYGAVSYYGKMLAGVKYHWIYPGTFYWVNMNSLYNYSLEHTLPKIDGRQYVEQFPGNLTPLKDFTLHEQFGLAESNYFFDDSNATRIYDFYRKMPNLLRACFDEERYNAFLRFVDMIKSKVIKEI